MVVDNFKMLERKDDNDNTSSSYQQAPKAEPKAQESAPTHEPENDTDDATDDLPF
ncbi:MAG: hypothetical protein LRY27_02595 [Chitinophagales bacterium]|nr:hypothetical protein [Chitinophagales bacterium]